MFLQIHTLGTCIQILSDTRLSSRPDTDSDTDADLEVNTKPLLVPTLGVGIGIAVESQHIQTAAKSVHLSIVDNRIQVLH